MRQSRIVLIKFEKNQFIVSVVTERVPPRGKLHVVNGFRRFQLSKFLSKRINQQDILMKNSYSATIRGNENFLDDLFQRKSPDRFSR